MILEISRINLPVLGAVMNKKLIFFIFFKLPAPKLAKR